MKRKLLSLTLALTTLLASNIGTLALGNVSASSETLETETTTTTEEVVCAEPGCYMKIVSNPDKTVYNIGDEVDLTGLKIDVWYEPGGEMPLSQVDNNWKRVIDEANPLEDDRFIVDTTEFDSSQVGSYNIKISLTNEASRQWWYCQSIYIPVTVTSENSKITGDANGDDVFNIADVIALNKWILNMPNITILNTNEVDFNSDGQVNIIDLCLMKNMLISQNNTPVLYASGYTIGSSFYSFEYVITADGNEYILESSGVDTNCACNTTEKHINHIMSDSTKKQFITTSEDLEKVVEFSKNATKYKDSELKKLDLTLADWGTFHLWMLYKDENGELQKKLIYEYGYDNAYLDNDEVKDFLKFLIENEYIDGNLNFFE